MINSKKTNKNEFFVFVSGINVINKRIGKDLLIKTIPLLEKHAVITIDLDSIDHIDSDGYSDLTEIVKIADKKNCDIHFTNINEELSELIETLTLTSES